MAFASKFLGTPGPGGFTLEMLEAFLRLNLEESLNLDYKDIRAADNPDKLSEVTTAFANSVGGLVLLGVAEKKDEDEKGNTIRIRPGEITWGPRSLTREKVESELISRVHPWVQGLTIHTIRDAEGNVIFLVDVPQSVNPPHQAADRRYYLRYNFQNLPMDHYQIDALFHRRLKPNLRPVLEIREVRKDGHEIEMRIGLNNEGGALAKHPMFFGTLNNCNGAENVEPSTFFFSVHAAEKDPKEFSVNHDSPIEVIHPRMYHRLGTVKVHFGGVLGITMLIAAEEMPTKKFWSGVSAKYLRQITDVSPKNPLQLAVYSGEEKPNREIIQRTLQQVGINAEEFFRVLMDAENTGNPKPLLDFLEEYEKEST